MRRTNEYRFTSRIPNIQMAPESSQQLRLRASFALKTAAAAFAACSPTPSAASGSIRPADHHLAPRSQPQLTLSHHGLALLHTLVDHQILIHSDSGGHGPHLHLTVFVHDVEIR